MRQASKYFGFFLFLFSSLALAQWERVFDESGAVVFRSEATSATIYFSNSPVREFAIPTETVPSSNGSPESKLIIGDTYLHGVVEFKLPTGTKTVIYEKVITCNKCPSKTRERLEHIRLGTWLPNGDFRLNDAEGTVFPISDSTRQVSAPAAYTGDFLLQAAAVVGGTIVFYELAKRYPLVTTAIGFVSLVTFGTIKRCQQTGNPTLCLCTLKRLLGIG